MSDSRAEVLRRIEAATVGVGATEVPRRYRTTGECAPGTAGAIRRFVERVEDYRASVVSCADAADVIGECVRSVLSERGVAGVLLAPGLAELAQWLPGASVDHVGIDARALDAVPAVVTGSVGAIAETGTIVLDASPRCGRRALSLVPDVHVCIVRAEDVYESVPEALAVLDRTAPLTLISGPSATSDIELHRVEGVHGPRTLIVVLVGEPS